MRKKPYGEDLRAQLIASAKDKLSHFTMDGGKIRGAVLHGTKLVNEMRVNHELGVLETLVLGHAYIAAGLMTAHLKGQDRVKIKVDCSGPVAGLAVEASAFGEVRGYLFQTPFPIKGAVDDTVFGGLFGEGVLSMTKHLEGAKEPSTGSILMEYGNLAEDLSHYFVVSEQNPSAFVLSIHFNAQGNVDGAGGLFVQALSEAEDFHLVQIKTLVHGMPSIGSSVAEGREVKALVEESFEEFSPQFLGSRRIAFMCHCGESRFRLFLKALPQDELQDLILNGPFPIVTTCFNCNTSYEFTRGDIQEIYLAAVGQSRD